MNPAITSAMDMPIFSKNHKDSVRFLNFIGRNYLILFLIIGFYLFWELRAIALPALQTDEALLAEISFRIIKNIPLEGTINDHLNLFGRWIPILTFPYHGAGESYLLIPFIFLGGLNVYSIRVFSISVGLITLLLLYFFCERLFNKAIAHIAIFLLAIDWFFMIVSKTGFIWGYAANIFLIGSLLCFLEWYKKRQWLYFGMGCFLAGMGLCIRVWFLWYVGALLASYIIFIRILKKKFSGKEIIISLVIGLIFFCIGALPLIYHEAKSHFGIVRYMMEHFFQTRLGYNNLSYIEHLLTMINNFAELPSVFFKQTVYGSSNKLHKFIIDKVMWFYAFLFLLSLIWHIWATLFKRQSFLTERRVILFLFFIIFLQTPITLSNLSHDHLLLLLPIAKILLGLFLFEAMNSFRRAKFAVITILIMLFSFHSYGMLNYHSILERTGGLMWFRSDAIYKVADFLKEEDKKNVVIMDFNLWHILYVLSKGWINEKHYDFVDQFIKQEKEELFHVKFNQQIELELNNRDNVYLFHSPEFTFVKCFDLFFQLAQKKNKQIREIKRFYRRDGQLAFLLYEAY